VKAALTLPRTTGVIAAATLPRTTGKEGQEKGRENEEESQKQGSIDEEQIMILQSIVLISAAKVIFRMEGMKH
jgi:hypothetical protein